MIKFQEFEENLQTRLSGYSLVKNKSLTLSFDEHDNEPCDEYLIVYHANQKDEWQCKYIRTFRFQNDDLLVLTFISGGNSGRTLPEGQFDKVYHLIEQLHGIANPIMKLSDFLNLSRKEVPQFTLKATNTTMEYGGKTFKAYTFVDVEPNDYPFSSIEHFKKTTVFINGQECFIRQQNDDQIRQENGTKILVMNPGSHTVPPSDIKDLFEKMVKARDERFKWNTDYDVRKKQEDNNRKQATTIGRQSKKLTIEQRKEIVKNMWDKYQEDIQDSYAVDDGMGNTIYYDSYKGVDIFNSDKDAYEAYLVISAYGGMMTDDCTWSPSAMEIVEALFPEYEFCEACEGLYTVSWKDGDTINEQEIEEINDILSQMPNFSLWTGERDYEHN